MDKKAQEIMLDLKHRLWMYHATADEFDKQLCYCILQDLIDELQDRPRSQNPLSLEEVSKGKIYL